MRNLKRALSLTLASVMLLGMMVIGSSAVAGYSDVDEDDNVEAIEVLQAIEVMVGDDRGFGPDRPVTRNEMAVVMGLLLNLDYNYYVSTCPFTDVAEWARGWVGACAANGIVSGRGEGIYDGEATVTAVEAASMMMRALGYFQYAEDYADGFQLVTVRQGSEIGIFNGVGTDGNTAMTRNQVAQMALNALRSNLVNFTGTPGIEVNGVKVGYRAEYTPRTGTEAKYDAITGLTTTILSDNGQYFIQLGEQLYDGDLRLDDAIDDYGRPARRWEYDGKGIGTYAKKELMRRDFTVSVKGSDMYDVLGSSVVTDARYTLDVYVDGAEYDPATTSNTYKKFTKANFTRSNDQNMDNTGRGVLTEIYVDNQSREITVAVINTFLAEATSDYSNAREELRVRVYNTTTGTLHTLDLEDFPEIASMKEGDFMLVKWTADSHTNPGPFSDYNVATILDTEIMTDRTVTRFTHDNAIATGLVTSLVTDGQTYDGNANLYYDANELEEYNKDKLTNKTYNVYLDQYGNAIGVDLYSGEDNYVFITGFDLSGTNTSTGNATANAIFLDGTMQSIRVNVKGTNDNIDDYNSSAAAANYRRWESSVETTATPQAYGSKLNTWYTYTLNETTGVYTLDVVDKDRQFATAAATNATTGTYDLKSSSLRLNGYNYAEGTTKGGAAYTQTVVSRAYGDQNSVFITVDTSEDEMIGKGYYVINEVKSVYTGVQNVNITSDTIWYDDSDGKTAAQGGTPDTGESSIYAVIDSKDYIIGAVVIGKDRGSTENYAYIYDQARYEERDADGTYYWGFNAIVNGEDQEIKVKSEYPTAVNTIHGALNSSAESASTLATSYGNDVGYLFRLSFDKDNYVVDAERFEQGGMTASTPGAHNDYIFASSYDNAGTVTRTGWNINADDEIIRYMKISTDTADELVIDRAGLTLYNNDASNDEGLAVREDAKITIIQTIRGSRRISEATGLREAWDYLVDYDGTSEDTKNYAGTISAVLDGTGRATWVVFDSKGGTNPNQNDQNTPNDNLNVSQIGGTINIASTTALDDAQIRAAIRNGLSGVATVEYPDASGKASITFTNGDRGTYTVNAAVVASAAAVKGAALMNKVQAAISSAANAADRPNPKANITIEGNTMIVNTANADKDYFNAASNNQSMHDLARFMGRLYTVANARTIVYNGNTYRWDATQGGASQSHWYDATNSTTLIAAIVSDHGSTVQGWTDSSAHSLTLSFTVDGNPMSIVLDLSA